jgi:hypothetical protein
MMLMDSTQRAVAAHAQQFDAADEPLVVDFGGSPAGFRPGFAVAAPGARDSHSAERGYYLTPGEAARQRRMIAQSEAWKSISYAKLHKPKPGLPGRDEAPQQLDRSTDEACQAIRDAAWARRNQRLANAWRSKQGYSK